MRRNESEQVYAVLEALAVEKLKLTHLMYKTNLNCLLLKNILHVLQVRGYVEPSRCGKVIHPLSPEKKSYHYNEFFVLNANGLDFYLKVKQMMTKLQQLNEECDRQRYLKETEALRNA